MVGHSQHRGHAPGGQWAPPRTSGGSGKALPIAIGAGLAVGVFLGLLLIRGTGEEGNAEAQTAQSGDEPLAASTGLADAGASAPQADAAKAAVATDADAAPAEKKRKTATITFDVRPANLERLEISVDGKLVEGSNYTVELDPAKPERKVTVRVKAKRHYSFKQRFVLIGDLMVEVQLKPRKRGSAGAGGGSAKPTKPGPGGLIDL